MDHAPGVPPNTQPAPSARRDLARTLRVGVCAGLVLSWLVMLLYAWSAFSTVPSAERLEQSRMTQIPTLFTFGTLALRSVVELLAVLALVWPAARLYLTRVLFAAFALAAYFLATAPLTVTLMEWVHRRWLAAVGAGLLGVFIAGATAAAVGFALSRTATTTRDGVG
jgi:hypothetical protein